LNAFFKCIKKMVSIANGNHDSLDELKERYISKRNTILSSLLAQKIRGKRANNDHYINDILRDNNDLLHYLKNLSTNLKRKANALEKSINYASTGTVTADSEHKGHISKHIFSALKVINGQWNNMFSDMWQSDSLNAIHWLSIDLLEPKLINRFRVIHCELQEYITLNYEIHGSNDSSNWDVLLKIENNDKRITVHDIKPCKYRFVKLYITKPCKNDFHARIYEFEILYCYN
jgi:hypothetical protein